MARQSMMLLLSVFVVGCSLGSEPAPPEDVDKASGLFFERLNSAQYDLIYNDSAELFKKTKTRPDVLDNLKQAAALGKHRGFERISMTFDKYDGKPIVNPVYNVPLDQGNAEYVITFMDDGGEWKLFGFAIKPRGATQQSGS